MGAVGFDELLEACTGGLVAVRRAAGLLALVGQSVDGCIGGVGHVVHLDLVVVGLDVCLLHGHVNHTDGILLVGLLERLHVERGTSLTLESEVLAAELGLGLQVVGQLAVAAAGVVALLDAQVDGILGEMA